MKTLKVFSPAKLNFYLLLKSKYPDGYHEIETLFYRISLGDTLRFRKMQGVNNIRLQCNHPGVPLNDSNLVAKAYHLLRRIQGDLPAVHVSIDKKIPVQAGLGGGSSNAASTLIGLNRLFRLRRSQSTLLSLGRELGADVPFFIKNTSQALGVGRGDKLKIVPNGSKKWIVLIHFKEGLSTPLVYRNSNIKQDGPSLTKGTRLVRISHHFFDQTDVSAISPWFINHLEKAACLLKPEIRDVLKLVVQLGVPSVAMSGSGPTVFAVLPSQQKAKELVKNLRQHLGEQGLLICHTY